MTRETLRAALNDIHTTFAGKDTSALGKSVTRSTWVATLCASIILFVVLSNALPLWASIPASLLGGYVLAALVVAVGNARGRKAAESGEAWEALLEDVVVLDVSTSGDVLDVNVRTTRTRYRTLDSDGNTLFETINPETEDVVVKVAFDVTDIILAQEVKERGERGCVRIYRVRPEEDSEASGTTTFTFSTWHSTHPVGIG